MWLRVIGKGDGKQADGAAVERRTIERGACSGGMRASLTNGPASNQGPQPRDRQLLIYNNLSERMVNTRELGCTNSLLRASEWAVVGRRSCSG